MARKKKPNRYHVCVCRWCLQQFKAVRDDARICSTKCRVARHRDWQRWLRDHPSGEHLADTKSISKFEID